jgi:hypothetical protein
MIVKNRFTDEVIGEFEIGSGADLRGANLRGADLRGADLRGANLSEADLREADLREANLRWANLRWANLSEADLRGANLSEANLRWANLSEASGFFCIGFFGKHHAIAAGGYISIGCERHTFEHWIKNYRAIGKTHEYTPDEIGAYGAWIEIAVKMLDEKGTR